MIHVPTAAQGLWQRQVISAPGFRDETTKVVWLQTERWFVDLRIPKDIPLIAAESLAEYSKDQLLKLAEVQAFAGTLKVRDDILNWTRLHDRHPPTGIPDEASCQIRGSILIENGIHAEYQEIWERLSPSQAPTDAFLLEIDGIHAGVMVRVADHLMEFVTTAGPAPLFAANPQNVWNELACGRRQNVERWLNGRVRYARRSPSGQWQTILSSLPWLVGKTFSLEICERGDSASARTAHLNDTADIWRAVSTGAPVPIL